MDPGRRSGPQSELCRFPLILTMVVRPSVLQWTAEVAAHPPPVGCESERAHVQCNRRQVKAKQSSEFVPCGSRLKWGGLRFRRSAAGRHDNFSAPGPRLPFPTSLDSSGGQFPRGVCNPMSEIHHECGVAAIYHLASAEPSRLCPPQGPEQVSRLMPRMLLDIQNRGQLGRRDDVLQSPAASVDRHA